MISLKIAHDYVSLAKYSSSGDPKGVSVNIRDFYNVVLPKILDNEYGKKEHYNGDNYAFDWFQFLSEEEDGIYVIFRTYNDTRYHKLPLNLYKDCFDSIWKDEHVRELAKQELESCT